MRSHWRKTVIVGVLAVFGAAWAGSITASAITWPPDWHRYTLHNRHTGYCLDSNGAGAVYTGPCNGGPYQSWQMYGGNSGIYDLVDDATGRCLDSNGSGALYTLPCNGGNYQHWEMGGSAYYQSATLGDAATGRLLDGNYGQAYTSLDNGGNWQSWVIHDQNTGGCIGPNC